MDKQKQIEEMARIFIKASCKGSECENCLYIDSVKEAKECCVCLKALYNAGYRKADDLLKELQSMKSDFAKDMLEIKETYEKEVVYLVNEVRKETAEKIFEKIFFYRNRNDTTNFDTILLNMAKEYGVEVK